MKKLYLLAVLVVFFGFAPKAGAQTSLNAGMAAGDSGSIAYDIYVQHAFDPFYSNESIELSPIVHVGFSAWDCDDATVWGGNLGGGLKLNFLTGGNWSPFIAGTFGGAWISRDEFENREMGDHFQFQSRGSVGVDFGESRRFSIKLDYTHYSNAGLSEQNRGYSTWGASVGYAFF